MSLALLVVGVIDHGSLNIGCSGAAPYSSGLVRLGRDLMRLSGRRSAAATDPGVVPVVERFPAS